MNLILGILFVPAYFAVLGFFLVLVFGIVSLLGISHADHFSMEQAGFKALIWGVFAIASLLYFYLSKLLFAWIEKPRPYVGSFMLTLDRIFDFAKTSFIAWLIVGALLGSLWIAKPFFLDDTTRIDGSIPFFIAVVSFPFAYGIGHFVRKKLPFNWFYKSKKVATA